MQKGVSRRGDSTHATLVRVDARTTMTAFPLNGQFAIYECTSPFVGESNKSIFLTTNDRSYVYPFNKTPIHNIQHDRGQARVTLRPYVPFVIGQHFWLRRNFFTMLSKLIPRRWIVLAYVTNHTILSD